MMCDKWSRCRSTRNRLQDWRFNFEIACIIEERSHRIEQFCSFHEDFFHVRIHDQIRITLSVTQFRICETIKNVTFGIYFWKWKRTKRFCQQSEIFHHYCHLSNLSFEQFTFDSDDITDIQKMLVNLVV